MYMSCTVTTRVFLNIHVSANLHLPEHFTVSRHNYECHVQSVQQYFHAGPRLAHKGAVFPNHGVIGKDPLGIGEDEDALFWVTDDVTCCGTSPSADCCGTVPVSGLAGDGGSGNGQGNWYFQNGDLLPSGTDTVRPFRWYARWLTGAVLINFRGTATQGTSGLHRCDILNSTGTLFQFYTCVYDSNNLCELCIIWGEPYIIVTSYAPVVHLDSMISPLFESANCIKVFIVEV